MPPRAVLGAAPFLPNAPPTRGPLTIGRAGSMSRGFRLAVRSGGRLSSTQLSAAATRGKPTLRTYTHAIPDAEEDLSFLDFGGSGRPYTAPPSKGTEKKKSGSGATDRNRSGLLARPARLERAASRSATWRSIQLSYGRVEMSIEVQI